MDCSKCPEVARLRDRLELSADHGFDAIDCRDATIALIEHEISKLKRKSQPMSNRRVSWTRWRQRDPDDRTTEFGYWPDGVGTFHAWGTESNGDESWPCAVVERDNGTVETVPANRLTFLDPTFSDMSVLISKENN